MYVLILTLISVYMSTVLSIKLPTLMYQLDTLTPIPQLLYLLSISHNSQLKLPLEHRSEVWRAWLIFPSYLVPIVKAAVALTQWPFPAINFETSHSVRRPESTVSFFRVSLRTPRFSPAFQIELQIKLRLVTPSLVLFASNCFLLIRFGRGARLLTASSFFHTTCPASRCHIGGDEHYSQSPDTNTIYCLIPVDIRQTVIGYYSHLDSAYLNNPIEIRVCLRLHVQ